MDKYRLYPTYLECGSRRSKATFIGDNFYCNKWIFLYPNIQWEEVWQSPNRQIYFCFLFLRNKNKMIFLFRKEPKQNVRIYLSGMRKPRARKVPRENRKWNLMKKKTNEIKTTTKSEVTEICRLEIHVSTPFLTSYFSLTPPYTYYSYMLYTVRWWENERLKPTHT